MIKHLKTLLRGEVDARCLEKPNLRWFIGYCIAIVLGSSVYGATIGLWRAPLQSVFTAIKFPLLIFLTCIGNGAVNGMLAQVLGSGLSFRQTAFAILMSFAVASLILGGFSPITLFILYNAPPLGSEDAIVGHSVMLLIHVFVIAFAGVIAHRRLLGLLQKVSGHDRTARGHAGASERLVARHRPAAPRPARRSRRGSAAEVPGGNRTGLAHTTSGPVDARRLRRDRAGGCDQGTRRSIA